MSKCTTVQHEKKIGELTIRKKVDGDIVKTSVRPSLQKVDSASTPGKG